MANGGGDESGLYCSRLSTTDGHITDCKLDLVVYAGVCVWVNVDLSCLGRTIYARQFLGAKPPIQFHHRWAERNHSVHFLWPMAWPFKTSATDILTPSDSCNMYGFDANVQHPSNVVVNSKLFYDFPALCPIDCVFILFLFRDKVILRWVQIQPRMPSIFHYTCTAQRRLGA